jgi:general secretion pathway protein C
VAIDAFLKRYFPALLVLLLGLAAYLQASGVTALAGGLIASGSPAARPKAMLQSSYASAPGTARRSAEPILERNVFDSVTGPFSTSEEASGPRQVLDLSDPLGASPCTDVQVLIITESSDPAWSLAAVKGPGDDHPKLRRAGDPVGDKKIAYIGYNARQGSPSVWLANDSSLCQVMMFAPAQPVQAQAAAAPAPSTGEEDPSKNRKGGVAKVPEDIASRIKKISETEFQVDRGVVDKILENQAALMSSARIVPEQKDGQVVGIRMFGVRPDTLLGTLGFENGDRLETINGFNMASPEKALEAYARLRTAPSLNVKVTRRGKPMNIDFQIK